MVMSNKTVVTRPKRPAAENRRPGLVLRALDRVERVGNRLPDPISLFLIMIGLVMLSSWLAAKMGLSTTHPGTGEPITPVNLFSVEELRRILVEMPRTFAAFPPLGLVLLVMLGIGVAERSGLLGTALKAFVRAVPAGLITPAIVFAGLLSNLAVDAGYVVLIPLGALVFYGVGRHPLAGLAAAFAGVSGGFSANLTLTALDPLLAGFTTPAAQIIDPGYEVLPTANWFLMAALVPLLTIAGTFVTDRIVEPRLGTYQGGGDAPERDHAPVSNTERRGLRVAAVVAIATAIGIALLVVPEGAVLRAPDDQPLLVQRIAPFLNSMVALMLFFFFLPGLAYGVVTGSIRSDRDVARMSAETMGSMGAYIVLTFVAAHLVAFFNWSNLGVIMAITGATFLRDAGIGGVPLLVAFVLVCAFINLFIGSASAKWAIMGTVFVPMFMLLGYSPELTQAAYRIGDSFTNILTPLLQYFPLIIIFAHKYDRKFGIGTLLAAMLPYSVAFALVMIPTLVLWVVLGLPLGPGAPMYYAP
jgi:aminobenzoyl-glutamate transport protein